MNTEGDDEAAVSSDEARIGVLHVLEPPIAGVPAYVDHLGRHLAAHGVEQHLIVADKGQTDRTWTFDEWASGVVTLPWRRRSLDTLRVARAIRRLVAEQDIDLVHAHASFAGIAARILPVDAPVVYQPHGWGFLSTSTGLTSIGARAVERLLAGRTDHLLVLSDQEEQQSPIRIPVRRVPPVVDLARFDAPTSDARDQLREELKLGSARRVHLCVGEISRRKNQVALAEEWSRVAPDGHVLVFVGDGAFMPELRAIAGNDPRFRLLGWRQDVNRLMGAADDLIIASLGEGFSLVIVEALATGLPVFSTRIGGSEAIGPDDGVIVDHIDDLSQLAIESELPDRSLDSRAQRAAIHQNHYSAEVFSKRFIDLYRQIVAGRQTDNLADAPSTMEVQP